MTKATQTAKATTPCGRYEVTRRATVQHVMYSCSTCKAAARVTMTYSYSESQRVVGRYTPPVTSGHQYRMQTGAAHRGKTPPSVACKECGEYMTGKAVRGTKNPSVKCGAKCRNAKGGECECECGGEHHGAGHTR